MTRRLVATYIALALVVLLALAIPLGIELARTQRRALASNVERDAFALASLLGDRVPPHGRATSPSFGRSLAHTRETRERASWSSARVAARSSTRRPPSQASGASQAGPRFAGAARDRRAGVAAVAHAQADPALRRCADRIGRQRPRRGSPELPDRHSGRARAARMGDARRDRSGRAADRGLAGRRARTDRSPPTRIAAASAAALGGGDLTVRSEVAGPPETRALATAFNLMASRLDDLVRAQQTFAADAAHELRTPLQALRFRLENLEGEVPPMAAATWRRRTPKHYAFRASSQACWNSRAPRTRRSRTRRRARTRGH